MPSAVMAEGGLSCHLMSGCGFPAPGAEIFQFDTVFSFDVFGLTFHVSKISFLMALAVVVIVGFFTYAFRRPKLVPRGAQSVGELGYLFVRDGIAREIIGKDGDKFVPFLFSFFFFIWLLNFWSIVPFAQISNLIVRPFTHSVRLFANMFAGHLLIATFSVATFYLISASVVGILGSVASFAVAVALTGFEVLIQALQAYIFTLLAAVYISGALHSEH